MAHVPALPEEVENAAYEYTWGHGSDQRGLEGIIKTRRVLRSHSHDHNTWGFWCQAVDWSQYGNAEEGAVAKVLAIPKGRQTSTSTTCAQVFVGVAKWHQAHIPCRAPNTEEEQVMCNHNGVVRVTGGRYCIREDIAQLKALYLGSIKIISQDAHQMYKPLSQR